MRADSTVMGNDALGRLSEIQKDGEIQTRYGYDAFGTVHGKKKAGNKPLISICLEQMVSERQGESAKSTVMIREET